MKIIAALITSIIIASTSYATLATFENGESNNSVRGKINQTIGQVNTNTAAIAALTDYTNFSKTAIAESVHERPYSLTFSSSETLVNGDYIIDGVAGGRPQYRKTSGNTNITISYQDSSGIWLMRDTSDNTQYYSVASTSYLPPEYGWDYSDTSGALIYNADADGWDMLVTELMGEQLYATAVQGALADTAVQQSTSGNQTITSTGGSITLAPLTTVILNPTVGAVQIGGTGLAINSGTIGGTIGDPTAGNMVGDRDYNDGRYEKSGQVLLISGETRTSYATINAAITAAASGDIILLGDGTFTEDINLTKSGISFVGAGSGAINWGTSNLVGGSQIDGDFTMANTAIGCSFEHLSFRNSSGDNVAFFGAIGATNVALAYKINDVTFYGDSGNIHCVEFRGGENVVENVKSYAFGTDHAFPIKAWDSVFRNIDVYGSDSGILIKSQEPYGNPHDLLISCFRVRGVTGVNPRVQIQNDSSGNSYCYNITLENGYIEADEKTGIRIYPYSDSESYISNVVVRGTTIINPNYGISTICQSVDTGAFHGKDIVVQDCVIDSPANHGFYNHSTAGLSATNIVLDGLIVHDGNAVGGVTTYTTASRVISY